MNLEESLDEALLNAIKVCTRACWRCDGKGVLPEFEDGLCYECDTCNGDKIIVATLQSSDVMAGVFGSVIFVAAVKLEKGDFDGCRRAVEWGHRLWAKSLSEFKGSVPDEIKKYNDSVKNSPLNALIQKTEVVESGSALSEDELKELMKE